MSADVLSRGGGSHVVGTYNIPDSYVRRMKRPRLVKFFFLYFFPNTCVQSLEEKSNDSHHHLHIITIIITIIRHEDNTKANIRANKHRCQQTSGPTSIGANEKDNDISCTTYSLLLLKIKDKF